MIVCAVPSPFVRSTAKNIADKVSNGQLIVNVSKGIEESTLKALVEIIEEEIPQAKVAVLSGPSHAEEVGRGIPTTVVAGARDIEIAKTIQNAFMNDYFRVYTSTDVTGIELGGSVKNVIALAAGISDGLGLGDNTKAALMTRGMAEIMRLGLAMGADVKTLSGLSGMGDLIVTCTSKHSRNRNAGYLRVRPMRKLWRRSRWLLRVFILPRQHWHLPGSMGLRCLSLKQSITYYLMA